jgi:hypothetical protein
MKLFKTMTAFLFIVCFAAALSACAKSKPDEFTSLQSFEYHFYPEEYEEAYSEYEKSFPLEADTDYQLQIDAACESGTIEICIHYKEAEDKIYLVNFETPCRDTVSIPANTADAVSFSAAITPETKGEVIGEIFARK